jgi:hypothetical protein
MLALIDGLSRAGRAAVVLKKQVDGDLDNWPDRRAKVVAPGFRKKLAAEVAMLYGGLLRPLGARTALSRNRLNSSPSPQWLVVMDLDGGR